MQEIGEDRLNLLRNDLEVLNSGKLDTPIDIDFSSALRQVNANINSYKMPLFDVREIAPFSYEHSNESLLLFSGGKVSLATAIRLRDIHKDITLYHIEESDTLTSRIYEMSDMLKLPLVTYLPKKSDKKKFSGMYAGINMVHNALEYSIYHGMSPRIYMGYFYMASINNNPRKDWKYCAEFMNAYNQVVQKYVRGAEVVGLLPNYSTVEDEFLKYKEFNKFFQ